MGWWAEAGPGSLILEVDCGLVAAVLVVDCVSFIPAAPVEGLVSTEEWPGVAAARGGLGGELDSIHPQRLNLSFMVDLMLDNASCDLMVSL